MRKRASSYRSRWGRSHSAYISEFITIHYRWCSFFGLRLPVLRRMRRQEGDWLVCEMMAGTAVGIPAWMADAVVCSSFSFGPPVVALPALAELRTFLGSLQAPANCDNSSGNTSSLECPDEADQADQSTADRAVLRTGSTIQQSDSRRVADSTQETELKKAVAELLLSIARRKQRQTGGGDDA